MPEKDAWIIAIWSLPGMALTAIGIAFSLCKWMDAYPDMIYAGAGLMVAAPLLRVWFGNLHQETMTKERRLLLKEVSGSIDMRIERIKREINVIEGKHSSYPGWLPNLDHYSKELEILKTRLHALQVQSDLKV